MSERTDEQTHGLMPAGIAGVRTVADLATVLRRLRRREARQRQGAELTYRQLATKAGWSHAVVADYLTGKILPPTDRFDVLVWLLGATAIEQGALATARDRVEESRRHRQPPATGAEGPPVPRQLPADVSAFTGRLADLSELDGLLTAGRSAVVIAAIVGMAGVGKTALAVHWGHRVQDRFADGLLYVNLRGYDADAPMRPIEALAHLMHALGGPAEGVPADVQTAAGLYRSLLADRRMLIVLDNAANADQVRPLLPGGPGCVVLVTSRDRLGSLIAHDGAHRLTLDVLTADEAHGLLVSVLGPVRLAAEPDAAGRLATACSNLPLALRIAAANVANHPWSSISEHVAALSGGRRLAALEIDDDQHMGVRRAFELSYRTLEAAAQRLFRLLGAAPALDVTAEAAAALSGTAVTEAGRQLDRLAAAHLLIPHAPRRYVCHDLLRRYAADRAEEEDSPADRRTAVRRLLDWYLCCADTAARVLYPHRLRLPVHAETPVRIDLDDAAGALAWLDDERANLVAAVSHAAHHGPHPVAWLLADTIRGYFWLRMHTVDWARAAHDALIAAEADGDLRAQTAALVSIGDLHHRQGRHQPGIDVLLRALTLGEKSGWLEGQAAALGFLGSVHRDSGRMREAAHWHGRALTLYREIGSAYGEAVVLSCLGRAHRQLGNLTEAAGYHAGALSLYREVGSRQGEMVTLHDLGQLDHAGERLDDATGNLERALGLAREIGDLGNEAFCLGTLAAVHVDAGHPDRALVLAHDAVAAAEEARDVGAETEARRILATILHRAGHHCDAAEQQTRALALARSSGERYREAAVLVGLATTQHALGDLDAAREHARRALAIAQEVGYRILDDRARAILELIGS